MIEVGDPIVYETRHRLGDMDYSLFHHGFVTEKNTKSVYVEWDTPLPTIELPERLTIAEANEKLAKHPTREKRK